MINQQGMKETLGPETYSTWLVNSDLPVRELGIVIEEGISEQFRMEINRQIDLSLQEKSIPQEVILQIKLIKNPYRQMMMLKAARKQFQQEQQAINSQNIEQQGEINKQNAIAIEQEKQKAVQATIDKELMLETLRHKNAMDQKQIDFINSVILKKIENQMALTVEEEKVWNEFTRDALNGMKTMPQAPAPQAAQPPMQEEVTL